MKKSSFSDPIDPAVMRFIESIALSFSRLHRFPSMTAQDLAQELAIKYLHVRATCDSSKVANWAWLRTVLLNECRSILRAIKAQKCWPRKGLWSLSISTSDDDGRTVDGNQTLRDPRVDDEPRRSELRRRINEVGKRRPAIKQLRDQVARSQRTPMPSQLERAAREGGFQGVDEMRQFLDEEDLRHLL